MVCLLYIHVENVCGRICAKKWKDRHTPGCRLHDRSHPRVCVANRCGFIVRANWSPISTCARTAPGSTSSLSVREGIVCLLQVGYPIAMLSVFATTLSCIFFALLFFVLFFFLNWSILAFFFSQFRLLFNLAKVVC